MKLLLIMVLFTLAFNSSAQQSRVQIQKTPTYTLKSDNKLDSMLKRYLQKYPGKVPLGFNSRLKPGLNYLPDGMPCIVPDEVTLGMIPNAWNGGIVSLSTFKYAIPNPARP